MMPCLPPARPEDLPPVRDIVAQAPPLTAEQRERLRPILSGTLGVRAEAEAA